MWPPSVNTALLSCHSYHWCLKDYIVMHLPNKCNKARVCGPISYWETSRVRPSATARYGSGVVATAASVWETRACRLSLRSANPWQLNNSAGNDGREAESLVRLIIHDAPLRGAYRPPRKQQPTETRDRNWTQEKVTTGQESCYTTVSIHYITIMSSNTAGK